MASELHRRLRYRLGWQVFTATLLLNSICPSFWLFPWLPYQYLSLHRFSSFARGNRVLRSSVHSSYGLTFSCLPSPCTTVGFTVGPWEKHATSSPTYLPCSWLLPLVPFPLFSARPFAGWIGGIDAIAPRIYWAEFTNLRMIDNSWIAWNVPAGNFHQGQVVVISALTTLLTVALVVLAAAIAFWRLLSHKWQMGNT